MGGRGRRDSPDDADGVGHAVPGTARSGPVLVSSSLVAVLESSSALAAQDALEFPEAVRRLGGAFDRYEDRFLIAGR